MRSSIATRVLKRFSKVGSLFCAVMLCCGLIPSAAFAALDTSLSLIPEGGEGAVPVVSGAEGESGDAISHFASDESLSVDGDSAAISSENAIRAIDDGRIPMMESEEDPSAVEESGRISQDVTLGMLVAQAESTKEFFLARTLESSIAVPMLSAKLPLDTSTLKASVARGESEGDLAEEDVSSESARLDGVANDSTVVGSFACDGFVYAIEPGGDSVAVVAADPRSSFEDLSGDKVIRFSSVATPDGVEHYSVARIADGVFASFVRHDLRSNETDRDDERVGAEDIVAVAIPASVTQIEKNAFDVLSALQRMIVSEANQNYAEYEGCLYAKDMSALLYVPAAMEHLVLPRDCTTVGRSSLAGCTSLSVIDAVGRIEEIDEQAWNPEEADLALADNEDRARAFDPSAVEVRFSIESADARMVWERRGFSSFSMMEPDQRIATDALPVEEPSSASFDDERFSTMLLYAATSGTVKFALGGGYMTLHDASTAEALDSVKYGDRSESFTGSWTIHVDGAFDWTRPSDNKRVRFKPSRENYEFAGWSGYKLGTAYAEQTGSVTLVATWHPILSFVTNGGTMRLYDPDTSALIDGATYSDTKVSCLYATETVIHVNGRVDLTRASDGKRVRFAITRAGYEFGGWSGYPLGSAHSITSSTTLTATWRPIITFVMNGGSVRLFDVSNNALDDTAYGDMSVTSLNDSWTIHATGQVDITRASDGLRVRHVVSREGYEFGGWEGYALGTTHLPRGAVTLRAVWHPKVTFDVDGGELWELDPSTGTIVGNVVLSGGTGTFVARTWGIHADGAVDFTALSDGAVHRYVAKKEGFEFGGWQGHALGSVHEVSGGVTLKAVWNPMLTFLLNGGTMRLQDASTNVFLDEDEHGDLAIAYLWNRPTDIHAGGAVDFSRASDGRRVRFIPSREGYTFGGWSGYPLGSNHSIVNSSVTLSAIWRPIVSFELDGGWLRLCDVRTGIAYDEVEYTEPAHCAGTDWTVHVNGSFDWNRANDGKRVRYVPVKTGYVFAGWEGYDLGTAYVEWESVTLRATWKALDYTVSYHLLGGQNSLLNPTGYRVDMPTITLSDPVRPGFVFQGWYASASFDEEDRMTQIVAGSVGDLDLYAKWQETSYVIAFDVIGEDDEGGEGESSASPIAPVTVDYTEVIDALPAPSTRSSQGYVFAGWRAGDDVVTVDEPISVEDLMAAPFGMVPDETGTLTLVARWTAIINVTVPTDVTILLDVATGEVSTASAKISTRTDYSTSGAALKVAALSLEENESAQQVFVDGDGVPRTSEVALTLSTTENDAMPSVRIPIEGGEAVDGDPLHPWGFVLVASTDAAYDGAYAECVLRYGVDYGSLDFTEFDITGEDAALPIASLHYTIAVLKDDPARMS